MKKLYILPILLFCAFTSSAQDDVENLISNGQFEEIEGKLKKAGQIKVATGWKPATGAKVHLFEKGNSRPEIGMPINDFGIQKDFDEDGKHYAGMVMWSYNSADPRGYLTTQLSTPLKSGVRYCVKFKVSLSDLSKYAVNNIGVHFSKKKIEVEEAKDLVYDAQIKERENKVMTEQHGWQDICGSFVAKGGEKFLVLGNFSRQDNVDFKKVKKPKGITTAQMNQAFYYVDDIYVYAIETESECVCWKAENINYSSLYQPAINFTGSMKPVVVANLSTVYFDFGSSELEGIAEKHLNNVVDLMNKDKDLMVKIVAHSDSVEYNIAQKTGFEGSQFMDIAQKRADAVLAYLISKGIDKSRFKIVVVDAKEPSDKSGTVRGLSRNRKVQFSLIK